MKVFNRIIVILFILTLFVSINAESASAATYVDKDFATLAKKGKLKGISGNIGMTYGSLKKLGKGSIAPSEAFLFHVTKKADYAFFYENSYTKIGTSQKVALIQREIPGYITSKQMQKYFGKPVAKNAYKAGKYYIRIHNNNPSKGKVSVQVGTKRGINSWYTSDEDGIYHIK
ncbi:hypothetical protein [Peribacillus glennii]|uniref:DUF4309 domain-containing protein n=1 Tax=Peribacillus glennii TaxID=2303991 RepID=A0A372LKQ6_9BACI|nr:hypothetical protein [Peribacillus glennii]RFU66681.1 hypothetical protein D0466_00775 [Peribacillus glennii]